AEQELSAQKPHPVVLHFWSTECAPCRDGLRSLERGRAALASSGAVLWTLNVDGPNARAGVGAFARAGHGAAPILLAGDDVIGQYSVINRYLFDYAEDLSVPTTIVIDAQGEIAKIYRQAVDATTLAADVAALDVSDAQQQLERAVPFPGTFL